MQIVKTLQVKVNRASVLRLWAAVVAERLGFRRDEALTMGRVVAGLHAHAKAMSLDILKPRPAEVKHQRQVVPGTRLHVDQLHRAVPIVHTPEGMRTLSMDKPVDPNGVQR